MSRKPTNERSPTASPRRTAPRRIRAIRAEHDRRHQHQDRDPCRDDPDKIAAEAVEVILDQSPVHHQQAEVEKARDQADPGREHEDRRPRGANWMRFFGSLAHLGLGNICSRGSRLKIHEKAHPPWIDVTGFHYTTRRPHLQDSAGRAEIGLVQKGEFGKHLERVMHFSTPR